MKFFLKKNRFFWRQPVTNVKVNSLKNSGDKSIATFLFKFDKLNKQKHFFLHTKVSKIKF